MVIILLPTLPTDPAKYKQIKRLPYESWFMFIEVSRLQWLWPRLPILAILVVYTSRREIPASYLNFYMTTPAIQINQHTYSFG